MAARRGDIGETTRLDFLLAAFDEEEMALARICSRKDTVKNCRCVIYLLYSFILCSAVVVL